MDVRDKVEVRTNGIGVRAIYAYVSSLAWKADQQIEDKWRAPEL